MLKQFDPESQEFIAVGVSGVAQGSGPKAVALLSYQACLFAWKKSGETEEMPYGVAEYVDASMLYRVLINGILNKRAGVEDDVIRKEVKKVFDAEARKAVTAYLASRVTA